MSALPALAPVEILEGCKPNEIPEHVYESQVPIVLKGLVDEWPAVQACSQSIHSAARYLSSFWSDKPMVHIAVMGDKIKEERFSAKHWGWPGMVSHWTLPELKGQNIKITTFSNCDEVELVVNGKSHGKKKLADYY